MFSIAYSAKNRCSTLELFHTQSTLYTVFYTQLTYKDVKHLAWMPVRIYLVFFLPAAMTANQRRRVADARVARGLAL
jgi:hypothetical protein